MSRVDIITRRSGSFTEVYQAEVYAAGGFVEVQVSRPWPRLTFRARRNGRMIGVEAGIGSWYIDVGLYRPPWAE